MINSEKIKNHFLENGYAVLPGYYNVKETHTDLADHLMKDYAYKIGRRYVSNQIQSVPEPLRALIYSQELEQFFNSFYSERLLCRDIMITNEIYHNKMERNNWLHFDRWKSLKAMVYLTDVCEQSGPFCVVPKTAKLGGKLRRSSKELRYEDRPNRMEIDFPNLYTEPSPIFGSKGTLILFDSDIFHSGGNINKGNTRMLIRSHWYANRDWQVSV